MRLGLCVFGLGGGENVGQLGGLRSSVSAITTKALASDSEIPPPLRFWLPPSSQSPFEFPFEEGNPRECTLPLGSQPWLLRSLWLFALFVLRPIGNDRSNTASAGHVGFCVIGAPHR